MDNDDRAPFPRSVYGRGRDPDPRFSLANERTFLAWIRTSLGLIASGVALMALPTEVREPFGRVTSVLLVALGIGAAIKAWVGWCRVELNLRLNRRLSGATFSAFLVAAVVVVGVILGIDVVR